MDRLIGRWWRALIRTLADPRANWQETAVLLRVLSSSVRTSLELSLVRLARRARTLAVHNLMNSLAGTYLEGGVPIFPAPPLERTEAAMADLLRRVAFQGDKDRVPPERMAEVVARGMAQGKTQREITRDLLPLANDVRASAMRVSRTFGMYVAGQESQQVHDELGDLVIGYQVHASLDKNTRPWHASRDGQIYYLNPKPGQLGMEKCPHPPLEAADPTERPPKAPRIAWNCVLPGQYVHGNIFKVLKAWYAGESFEIRTASGSVSFVTANHPILTENGFAFARQIEKGQHLWSHHVDQKLFRGADKNQGPSLIEDVAVSLGTRWLAKASTAFDFYGDGEFLKGKVRVIGSDFGVGRERDFQKSKKRCHFWFKSPHGAFVGRCGLGGSLRLSHSGPLQPLRFALPAGLNPHAEKPFSDRSPVDPKVSGDLIFRTSVIHVEGTDNRFIQGQRPTHSECFQPPCNWLAANPEVSAAFSRAPTFVDVQFVEDFKVQVNSFHDKVISIRRFWHDGPVYDVETDTGVFLVSAGKTSMTLQKQCRCYLTPVLRPEREVRRDRLGRRSESH